MTFDISLIETLHKKTKMNGYSAGSGEEDSRDSKRSHDQLCCLIEFDQVIDDGERCPRMAGNASYRYYYMAIFLL